MTRTDEPEISQGQNHGKAQVVAHLQRGAGQLHDVDRMNYIGRIGFQFSSEEFRYVRIVIFGPRRISSTAQVVMQLGNWNPVVLNLYGPVIKRIKRRRFDMRNHPHRMPCIARAHRQTMRIDFGAADVPGQVLMCEISNLHEEW